MSAASRLTGLALLIGAGVLMPPSRAEGPAPAISPAVRADAPVVVRPVLSSTVTSSGQPIVLPQQNAQVIVSTYDIAAGAALPQHRHPFPRYAYVLAGTLRVTNAETGKSQDFKPGDFVIEAVGQWHSGAPIGPDPVKLVVIDMVEAGRGNTELRK